MNRSCIEIDVCLFSQNAQYGYVNVDYDFPGMEAANGLMLSACGVELILLIVQIYISARALKEVYFSISLFMYQI